MMKKDQIKKYCKLAVQNILYEGITDVDLFNRPFEIDLLKNQQFATEIESAVVVSIISGKLNNLDMF